MALALYQSQKWALAPVTEITQASSSVARHDDDVGIQSSQQCVNILSLAETQAMRLAAHGSVRREPGYDVQDDFIDDSKPPLELGVPCILSGSGNLVAYMGQRKEADMCLVLPRLSVDARDELSVCPRSQLLPLPLRPVQQGDWALPIRLEKKHSRFYGYLCMCGPAPPGNLIGYRSVMFPRGSASCFPPELLILRDDQLVTLPDASNPVKPPWERYLKGVEIDPQLLPHEAILTLQEQAIHGLAQDTDEEDPEKADEGSESCGSLSSVSDEETPSMFFAPGVLVQVMDVGPSFAKIAALSTDHAELVMLNGKDLSRKVPQTALSILSRRRLVRMTTCCFCHGGPPKELVLCRHFGERCVGAMHSKCLAMNLPSGLQALCQEGERGEASSFLSFEGWRSFSNSNSNSNLAMNTSLLCGACQARQEECQSSQKQSMRAFKRPLEEIPECIKRVNAKPARDCITSAPCARQDLQQERSGSEDPGSEACRESLSPEKV